MWFTFLPHRAGQGVSESRWFSCPPELRGGRRGRSPEGHRRLRGCPAYAASPTVRFQRWKEVEQLLPHTFVSLCRGPKQDAWRLLFRNIISVCGNPPPILYSRRCPLDHWVSAGFRAAQWEDEWFLLGLLLHPTLQWFVFTSESSLIVESCMSRRSLKQVHEWGPGVPLLIAVALPGVGGRDQWLKGEVLVRKKPWWTRGERFV